MHQFIEILSNLKPNAMFLSLNGYTNAYSEVANYSLIFHFSYQNALKKSISILQDLTPSDSLEQQAQQELINSFQTSLQKMEETPVEDIEDGYRRFFVNGNHIKGIKFHEASETLHLYGLVAHKKVIAPGVYDNKDSRKPLTKAKDKLRNQTPISKFRQFKIIPEQLKSISVQNLTLLPPESLEIC